MKRQLSTFTKAMALSCVLLSSSHVWAAETQSKNMAEPAQISWDLTELYATAAAWEQQRVRLTQRVAHLKEFAGTLGKDAKSLASALDEISDVAKHLTQLYTYASLRSTVDLRNADNQELIGLASALFAEFEANTSFIKPELLAVGKDKIATLSRQDKRLQKHSVSLDNILRLAPNTLGEEAENVLALSSPVQGGASSIYSLLANSGIEWPEMTIDGETVTLSQSMYAKYRGSNDRTLRQSVFETFWDKWATYQAPLGQTLDTQIKAHVFAAKARHYDSALASAVSGSNIPTEIYEKLIEATNRNLPTLHRYLNLRKRMLGVERLEYFDMYPALVKSERSFPLKEAKQLTLAALKPYGEEYMAQLDYGLSQQWMHVYPQPGKRPGAYMSGSAYEVHPYVFLNYNGGYDDVSTFAHEWGHAIHSMLANKYQPWEKSDYPIFTAEIASITNELMLLEHMLKQDISDDERLYYLGSALESMRGTYFRQTMFAEFELKAHQLVEQGEAISGKKLSQLYLALLKKYYGHEQGVTHIDERYGIEWAYIPHFYYNFYVYQYATSMAGASMFANRIMNGDEDGSKDFVALLSAGGSEFPHPLLKRYGIDLSGDKPYDALAVRMEALMDRIEAILNKKA